ncbi:metallopeptidase [Candidatus Gottesmanbacteria bacterium]|nr:metallopeptidase [Candidatus Gottesmanbacteria bacterium]
MEWTADYKIKKELQKILRLPEFSYINGKEITLYRSYGSSSRAYARIWGLPRVWQQALSLKPHYIIEVISERFNKLSPSDQIKTLIHELLHIPKNFSGALVPHKGRRQNINHDIINRIYDHYYSRQ